MAIGHGMSFREDFLIKKAAMASVCHRPWYGLNGCCDRLYGTFAAVDRAGSRSIGDRFVMFGGPNSGQCTNRQFGIAGLSFVSGLGKGLQAERPHHHNLPNLSHTTTAPRCGRLHFIVKRTSQRAISGWAAGPHDSMLWPK